MGARALTRILTTVVVALGVVGASVSAPAQAAPSTRSIASVNNWSCSTDQRPSLTRGDRARDLR